MQQIFFFQQMRDISLSNCEIRYGKMDHVHHCNINKSLQIRKTCNNAILALTMA
jgi:hypothetical protein